MRLALSEKESYVEVFRALAEPVRLEMLLMIARQDDYPCTALTSNLSLAKSTISYHIRIMRGAGLIEVQKDGRNFRYRVRREVVDHFLPGLLERREAILSAYDGN
jgi:ArsR family transcriptional regulator, arsenate/arsenite/antimonite-responsive transcriptional repressor